MASTLCRDTRPLARPRLTFVLLAALLSAGTGCAATPALPPAPIVSSATLGQIVIYRNGVAYFERYAPAHEKEVTLRVPRERVDDFLKSLSIVDEKTGETMPVSYPTLYDSGSVAEMTIKLPPKHNGLKITYVTESPAWKPSYRLVLGDDNQANLQGWAIVDNVSGEDWKQVKIGVGSTSALSFRYDLQSVRTVQRETLGNGSLVALAPPTGGSPYANGKAAPVLANVGQSALDELVAVNKPAEPMDDWADSPFQAEQAPRIGTAGRGGGAGRGASVSGGNLGGGYRYAPSPSPKPARAPRTRRPGNASGRMVQSLSRQLRSQNKRVRVEGFARAGDKDRRSASMARANLLRDQLIANGVPADRIDAIGTGEVNNRQGAQIVAVQDNDRSQKGKSEPQAGAMDAVLDSQPMGQAHFVSAEAMTIQSDHSAMVSIFNDAAIAERVYYYDPISNRGSKDFAFNAVKLVNPSEYTLDSGPFTVYMKGQFLGEGLSEPILPKSKAFIPYALDRSIVIEPETTMREEIDKLITIQRGIASTEMQRIRKTELAISNRGKKDAVVYVRHQVGQGYKLRSDGLKMEKLAGAHLLPVRVAAGETTKLVIEESTPILRSVDIRYEKGIDAISLYLKKANIDADLKKRLDDVVRRHRARADLEERIRLLDDQMRVYRTRVDEINVQLVTLRKVTQAARLRQHLSTKMEEISEKIQQATLDVSDLKGKLMTLRIELQDSLAELTLRRPDDNAETADAGKAGQ